MPASKLIYLFDARVFRCSGFFGHLSIQSASLNKDLSRPRVDPEHPARVALFSNAVKDLGVWRVLLVVIGSYHCHHQGIWTNPTSID